MFKQAIDRISCLFFIICVIVQSIIYLALNKFKSFMFIEFIIGIIGIAILFVFLKLKFKNKVVAINIISWIIVTYALLVFLFFCSFGGNAEILKTGQYAIVNHGTIVKYISYNEYNILKLYYARAISAIVMGISWIVYIKVIYCE